jgi:hypothetical protein
MPETELTAAQADALAGTTDSDTDFKHHTIGESAYYTEGLRQRHRILTILKVVNALRVYKDGTLTFGVRPGKAAWGDSMPDYAGASEQALTDDATNYVYLSVEGGEPSLNVNTTGFPDPSDEPHVPLASIVTASGAYGHGDITDHRGRGVFTMLSAMTAAGANTLVGGSGSNADALHVHAVGGLEDALQDLLPDLSITAGAEAADKRTITVQARDAAANNLAERVLVRVWIAASDYGAPSATGNTVAVETGTTYETETANAAYKIISDAAGKAEIGVTISGAATRYVMAEIDGRIYSSGEITWAA